MAGELLADAIEASVARSGRCRLGLAGGSSAGPVLSVLIRRRPADDREVRVTWIDERHPEASNESAARAVWRAWRPEVLSVVGGGTLDEDAVAFEQAFARRFGGLDVLLLGCGPDGHVASLFPDHPSMSRGGTCFAVTDSPKPPPTRITLSLEVLAGARHTIFVAKGAAKADVVARARAGDRTLPLGILADNPGHWVLDPEAAGALP